MARRDITMTQAEIDDFLSAPRVLELATIDKDGYPHLAPMWYVYENGRIVFRSFTKSQKIVNLRRDPRLSVLVEEGVAYGELRGVMIRGEAILSEDPGRVLELYRRLSARYPMVGDTPTRLDDEALEAAFGRYAAKNTIVEVEPIKVATWDHRKLGGAY